MTFTSMFRCTDPVTDQLECENKFYHEVNKG